MRLHVLVFIAIVVFGSTCVSSVAIAKVTPTSPIPTRPEHVRPGNIQLRNPDGGIRSAFAFGVPTSTSGGSLAIAREANVDRFILLGAQKGEAPTIQLFTTQGVLQKTFLVYPPTFKGGVRLTTTDIDHDGTSEIVVSPGPGMPPEIRVFRLDGSSYGESFLAYPASFKGGVHIAAADLDGDGNAEIITSPGPGGGPDIRVWDVKGHMKTSFFAFDAKMEDGVSLAIARTPDGAQILVAPESWAAPMVRRFRTTPAPHLVKEFYGRPAQSRTGVTLAAVDLDHDGYDEIGVSSNGGERPTAHFFDIYGTEMKSIDASDATYRGAISFAQIDGGSQTILVSTTINPTTVGPTDREKMIDVNISQQRLYAYEHGRIARSFLVSTGVGSHPTPLFSSTVRRKIPIMDYRWSYGPGNPNNYALPNVKYNLNVWDHIYIHSAYWHNNFGKKMSHGCINTSLEDAHWIFDWAPVGTPVLTHL